AAPEFAYAGGLDGYDETLLAIERYFHMPAESFRYMMTIARSRERASAEDPDWRQGYAIVSAAHAERIHARRRGGPGAPGTAAGGDGALRAMLQAALGETIAATAAAVDAALQKLEALGIGAEDRGTLAAIAAGTEAKPDWARVARVLEVVQCNREDFREPVPE